MHKVLAKLKSPYSINKLNENDLIVGSEADGELLLLSAPEDRSSIISRNIGGFMCILPFNTGIIAIGNFKPVFKGEDAGVFVFYPSADIFQEWNMRKIVSLPFVHRIEILYVNGNRYLVCATICGGKDSRDDWEKPGGVYISLIPDVLQHKILNPVQISGLALRKNHGLFKTYLDGYDKEGVLVSAQEGVFFITPPDQEGLSWSSEKIIDGEISDIFTFDIDNCGKKEIIALEQFHGNILSVYKRVNSGWSRFEIDTTLNFAHVVWAGIIKDKSQVIAGSRGRDEELSIYTLENSRSFQFSKRVILKNVGASQLVVGNMNYNSVVYCTCTKNHEVIVVEI